MSAYPQAFTINKVGDLTCNNNFYYVDNSLPIMMDERRVVPAMSTTTHCQAYRPPMEVIQDNTFPSPHFNERSWSNHRGYGNIVVATHDTCNNIRGRVHPWNRIPKLDMPYSGPAVIEDAWNLNRVKTSRCQSDM